MLITSGKCRQALKAGAKTLSITEGGSNGPTIAHYLSLSFKSSICPPGYLDRDSPSSYLAREMPHTNSFLDTFGLSLQFSFLLCSVLDVSVAPETLILMFQVRMINAARQYTQTKQPPRRSQRLHPSAAILQSGPNWVRLPL